MKKRNGFTLIELLVVITIIAILLAILIPSLKAVKELATGVVCLYNQRGMVIAYRMYSEDNDAYVPVGVFGIDDGWVADRSGDHSLGARIDAIERGSLFPYTETQKVYHCPGDTRWRKGTIRGDIRRTADQQKIYVSYSLPISLNNSNGDRKFTDIKNPAGSYLFVEDGYDGKAANNETWSFVTNCRGCSGMSLNKPDTWRWHDPMGMFHTDGCTLSFVDGHAEKYKWRERDTKIFFTDRESDEPPAIRKHDILDSNQDIEYMFRRMPEFRYRLSNKYFRKE